MTDRERHGLRGPVRSVRSEHAVFDPKTDDWGPFRQGPTLVFGADGNREESVPGGDTGVTSVDERGLRTTVSRGGPRIDRPPGLEWGMSFDPSKLADVLTRYDSADRPVEIVFRTAAGTALHRVEATYDGNGRLARERVVLGDDLGQWFPSNEAIAAGQTEPPSPEEQQQLTAMLKKMLLDSVFMTREYEYDDRGRVIELRSTMAGLSETLQTYSYDDRDNLVEEHHQQAGREADLDPAGRRITQNETTSESWTRYEYRYDDRGNWIERVALGRQSRDSVFRRSSIERRALTYF